MIKNLENVEVEERRRRGGVMCENLAKLYNTIFYPQIAAATGTSLPSR